MFRIIFAVACAILLGGWYRGTTGSLPLDANGWAIFPAPASITGQIYYVSTTDGNDTNTGHSTTPNFAGGGAGPFRTIQKAVTQLTADVGGGYNHPGYKTESWILLKKGDSFIGAGQSFGNMLVGGVSIQRPMIIGSYDTSLPTTLNGQPNVVNPYGNVPIASLTCSAGTITATTVVPHNWVLGNGTSINVAITGALPGDYNNEYGGVGGIAPATITGASTFTATVSACPASPATTPGTATLMRPLIGLDATNSINNAVIFNSGNPGVQDFLVFTGIHGYAYKLDPNNASFDPAESATNFTLINQNDGTITWRWIEDNKADFALAVNQQYYANYTFLRRNIAGRFYNSSGNDFYFDGVRDFYAYQNLTWFTNWYPPLAVGQSVSVDTGTDVLTWGGSVNVLYNAGGSCARFKFTGSPLPTGITAGTTYSAINIVGATFQVSASCGGSAINLSGSPSGVIGYFQNAQNAGTQSSHDYYLQGNGAVNGLAFTNVNIIENIMAMGSTVCECGNGGIYYNNMQVNTLNGWFNGKGVPPAISTNVLYTASYNTFFKPGPLALLPTPFGPASITSVAGPFTGPTVFDHNLLANESTITGYASNGQSCGFCGVTELSNQATISNNIVCGIGYNATLKTALTSTNGQPVALSLLTTGSALATNAATTTYSNETYEQISFVNVTPSPGVNSQGTVTVNGTTGQVTAISFPGTGQSRFYRVNDVISTADNSKIGGVGSGWSATVTSVSGTGNITGKTITGGSSYVAPYNAIQPTGGGGATLAPVHVNVAVGPFGCVSGGVPDCVATGVYRVLFSGPFGGWGAGYSIGDTLTMAAASLGGGGGSTSPTARVDSIINNTYSNNTYQSNDCNNLQNGGDQAGLPAWYVPSVAPPLTPSTSPPTDVVGDYFASLPIGYSTTVVGIDSSYSSDNTQGFLKAASLQQKGNWDTRLTAGALNNWARPQFGMANP